MSISYLKTTRLKPFANIITYNGLELKAQKAITRMQASLTNPVLFIY